MDHIVDPAQLSPCGGGALAKVMIVRHESNISSPTKAIEIAFSTWLGTRGGKSEQARWWGLVRSGAGGAGWAGVCVDGW